MNTILGIGTALIGGAILYFWILAPIFAALQPLVQVLGK
jgi:hypothetical protein